MKNVDYICHLLLAIIAFLLLILVMKTDPPVKPPVDYDEVVCGEGRILLRVILGAGYKSSGPKLLEKRKIIERKMDDRRIIARQIAEKLSNDTITCYSRYGR